MGKIIDPAEISGVDMYRYLIGAVVPRPIALVSSVDAQGQINLSPFSFFNVFSGSPPILIFSPTYRSRDNSPKDTLENVRACPEVVVHIVTEQMAEQMAISSGEFERGENEFVKAGFEALPSQRVKPPRVAASPIAMECRVNEIIPLGRQGGAGNLVICEVLLMHIAEEVLDGEGWIDPLQLQPIGRMGGAAYCSVNVQNLFEIRRTGKTPPVGVDRIPPFIRYSGLFAPKQLGVLGNLTQLPDPDAVRAFAQETLSVYLSDHGREPQEEALLKLVLRYVQQDQAFTAWKVILAMEAFHLGKEA